MKSLTSLTITALASAISLATSSLVAAPNVKDQDRAAKKATPLATEQLIIKYKDQSMSLMADNGNRFHTMQDLSSRAGIEVQHKRKMSGGADVLSVPKGANVKDIIAKLAQDPNVEYVVEDRMMYPLRTPNDTSYNLQHWHFDAKGGANTPAAWDITTGSSSVVIAVLDTGILSSHPDFSGKLIQGRDMISSSSIAGDGNGRDSNPEDVGDASGGFPSSWHGSHVAGIAAAATNNSRGVAGVSWGAKIQAVRVLGKGGGTNSDIIDGIRWAAGLPVSGSPTNANPADIINMSLGGSGACDAATQSAINDAVNAGVVVVIASGNDAGPVSNAAPANCNNVISVAATRKDGGYANYSNFGSLIDISAPGGEGSSSGSVYSIDNSGTNGPVSNTYGYKSGTSMATPVVAGVIALMKSVNSNLTPAEIETIIKDTARSFPTSAQQCNTNDCGDGIIDARAAVAEAQARAGSGGGGGGFSNTNNVTIVDNATVESTINVTGRAQAGSFTVNYDIKHTYKGDLIVKVVLPGGAAGTIHDRSGGSADNVIGSTTFNGGTLSGNGTWKLTVQDTASGDVGFIDSWSITFN